MADHPLLKIPDLKPPPARPKRPSSPATTMSAHSQTSTLNSSGPDQQRLPDILNVRAVLIFSLGAVAGKLSFPLVSLCIALALTFLYTQNQKKSVQKPVQRPVLEESLPKPVPIPKHQSVSERQRVVRPKRAEASIDQEYAFRPYG